MSQEFTNIKQRSLLELDIYPDFSIMLIQPNQFPMRN